MPQVLKAYLNRLVRCSARSRCWSSPQTVLEGATVARPAIGAERLEAVQEAPLLLLDLPLDLDLPRRVLSLQPLHGLSICPCPLSRLGLRHPEAALDSPRRDAPGYRRSSKVSPAAAPMAEG